MDTRVAPTRPAVRHPHVVSATVAVAVLAALVLGPWLHGLATDKHTDGRWILRTAPTPIPSGLMLTVEGDELRGQAPCNTFGSPWSQDKGPTGDMYISDVGCAPDLAEQEDAYLRLLDAVETVDVEGDQMVLSGPDGRLVFDRTS